MNIQRTSKTRNIVLAAFFLALGMVLPNIFANIKEIGDSLLPLHLVVMLCGAVCGWKYAAPMGLMLPFMRSMIFSRPPLYPNAVWMALELATYGFVIGFLFSLRKKYSRWYLFVCLVSSMLAGRIVWAIAKTALLGIAGKAFTFGAFLAEGFVDAVPGLILQFILVPTVVEVIYQITKKSKSK